MLSFKWVVLLIGNRIFTKDIFIEFVTHAGLQVQAALFIQQGETQVEPPDHFNKPLHRQGRWHNDQHPARPASDQLLMQDKPCLNRLAQANFIRQQHPGRVTASHLIGNVKLMGHQ